MVRRTSRNTVDLPANDSPIGVLSLSNEHQNTDFVIRLGGMMLLHMSRTQSISVSAAYSAPTFSVSRVRPSICTQAARITGFNLQTDRIGYLRVGHNLAALFVITYR